MHRKPACVCDNNADIRCDAEHCDFVQVGAPMTHSRCQVCWLRLHDEAHNRAYGGDGKVREAPGAPVNFPPRPRVLTAPERTPLPCVHLGAETSETVRCTSCPGSVRLKVFQCAMHSRAVLGHDVPSTHGCLDCPDRTTAKQVPEAGKVRHLLFHLYPHRDGGVWRWHAEQLRRHVGLFNGRRVLALALDEHTEDAAVVREVYAPLFDEVLEFPNDPKLREVRTFEALFSRVRSMSPEECFLWAHGKGASRPRHPWARRWTELLYELNLGRWEDVRELLAKYPVVGSFKKTGAGWNAKDSLSDWHYSGSWAWYRSRDLFGKGDWRRIDRFWSGIEAYPSLHFTREQAGCLFFEFPVDPQKQLYQEAFWRQTVEPAYEAWKASKVPRVEGLKVEIGGGGHPRGEGFIDVDRTGGYDLETCRLPFEDDSVAEVYSSHCFEHIRNLHHLLHEVVRVCKVGALVEVRVPHWLSPMALCHDHKQVIPPEQVEHWCKTAVGYWWSGCTKRLRHLKTEQVPGGSFSEAKKLHPGWTDEQVMRYVPGAAHEVRYTMEVIPHEAAAGNP